MSRAQPERVAGWQSDVARRARTLLAVKAIGTPLGVGAFFIAYFWALRHPLAPVTTMPLIGLDGWVGFVPEALPLYASLWLYVSLAPALIDKGRDLLWFGLACLALTVLGVLVFLVWPTTLPAFDIDWSRHQAFAFLRTVDVAGNACPSLHVAFAVLAACWLARALRDASVPRTLRLFSGVWCLGIVYSTLAVRQHVALDVLAGAALGAAVAAASLWRRPRLARVAPRPPEAVAVGRASATPLE